jgi:nicotinamidase-related amidase
MAEKALINIDYTVDFVADDGALTCGKPGQAIEDNIVRITEDAVLKGDLVVFAVDVHYPGDAFHPETKLFPPHNLAGTPGRQLYGKLHDLFQRHSGRENVLYLDKTRYSAFAGTNLDIRLRERGVTEVHLVGVCTDICVLHTAVDAYNLGYRIVVHRSAVASFNPAGHEWALEHFAKTLGAEVV